MPGGPEMPAFEEPALPVPKYRFGIPGKAKIIIILVGGLLLTVGLGRFVWAGLRMTVSEPTLVGEQMQGTFTIHVELFGFPSHGFGGACMIGDFAHLMSDLDANDKGVVKGACTTQKQCNPKWEDGLPPGTNPQKWYGYCIKNRGEEQGKCWYKPTDASERQLCEKSVYHKDFGPNGIAWPDGLDPRGKPWWVGDHRVPDDNQAFKVQNFYDRYTAGKPAKWRIAGLLIGKKPGAVIAPMGDHVCISPKGQSC